MSAFGMHVMQNVDTIAHARLEERVSEALSAARRSGRPALAAVTVSIPPELDLSAVVLAARRTGDRYACLEQPNRDGFVLGGPGPTGDGTEQTGHRSPDHPHCCRSSG